MADTEILKALYSAFCEEDLRLAQLGLEDCAILLAVEEKGGLKCA